MRKHNKAFAIRGNIQRNEFGVLVKPRSNRRAHEAHQLVNNKFFQYIVNFPLQALIEPFLPKIPVPQPEGELSNV